MGSEKIDGGRAFPHKMEIMSSQAVDKIIAVTLGYLGDTGIKFDSQEQAYDTLTKAGCDIASDGMVKFSPDLVKECLGQCPDSYKWWNREGTECVEYGSGNTCFISSCWAPNYLDPYTGEKKSGDQDGIAILTKLNDALSDIDISGIPITTGDMVTDSATMMANTTKPVHFSAGEDANALRGLIELGTALRGSIEKLREKPYFTLHINPEMLRYPAAISEQIQLCAENNIPITIATMGIGGLSSPITMAGTLTMCLLTTIPGIVLAQLLKKGLPCTEASTPSFMDPATAAIRGIPENALTDMAKLEVCRKLGPLVGQLSAFGAITPEFNQDAMAKITWDFGELATCSFDSFLAIGAVDTGLLNSPQATLYANELAGMARRVWRGIPVDDDDFAMDVIKSVGAGMYLTQTHTALHARKDLWRGDYIKNISLDAWEEKGKKDMSERMQENLKEILDSHTVEPLSEPLQKAVDDIVAKYK
jgi:trimethylamine---corrinoid protein Co-methyltransferase